MEGVSGYSTVMGSKFSSMGVFKTEELAVYFCLKRGKRL